jgi:hypothetical protein
VRILRPQSRAELYWVVVWRRTFMISGAGQEMGVELDGKKLVYRMAGLETY